MSLPRFDQYYRYGELSQQLAELAATFPHLLKLSSIGQSFEGRDIWLVTATAFNNGDAASKPALWVDANIHAAELAGSSACLHLISTLVTGYEHREDIRRSLDDTTFYICPRVNPDGAEWALEETPRLIRSSVRPYPYDEPPLSGVISEDIDADGRILSMRIKDSNGPWKICPEDSRLLIAREPTERGGTYYRILPEGRIENYDGVTLPVPPKKEGLDLNRNFPCRWRGEFDQKGAGPYPTSEPEVQALVRFITQHPNICAGIALHSYSGALLRPYSFQPDEAFPPEDLWTFEAIGRHGTQLTGYPCVSAFHEFKYHPKQVISGSFDDWLYEELGIFAWTVELWSPHRQAGIEKYQFIDWYRSHSLEDDLKLLRWNDTALKGAGFVDWYTFQHPQLGEVELGGWNPLYSFWNPPPHLLEKEIEPMSEWLIWHALLAPKLAIHSTEVKQIGEQSFAVRLVVENTGWLPTYITKHAQQTKNLRGIIGEIQLPPGACLLQGQQREQKSQLEGRAYKSSSMTTWAGQTSDPSEDRIKIEWVVQANQGTPVTVCAYHDRAGRVETSLTLN